ncbi:MAG: hypothetical protein IJX26_03745 [Clostridia bacterium]|nr:hypothetical protein [Clostridia bacterium]
MKFLKKLKSGNFWISIISAGVLIAEVVFDFEIKTEYLNQILLGLMGVLTMFGIVTDHGTVEKTDTTEATTESVSNIKTICDTVSLMLNKVSINSNPSTDVVEKESKLEEEISNLDLDTSEESQSEEKTLTESETENQKEEEIINSVIN